MIIGLFQGLVQQTLQIGRFFIALLVYLLAFGASVSVTIEDGYSGAVRVVDNVPVGPAAVGSALSNVGYGVTRLDGAGLRHPGDDRAWLRRCAADADQRA